MRSTELRAELWHALPSTLEYLDVCGCDLVSAPSFEHLAICERLSILGLSGDDDLSHHPSVNVFLFLHDILLHRKQLQYFDVKYSEEAMEGSEFEHELSLVMAMYDEVTAWCEFEHKNNHSAAQRRQQIHPDHMRLQ